MLCAIGWRPCKSYCVTETMVPPMAASVRPFPEQGLQERACRSVSRRALLVAHARESTRPLLDARLDEVRRILAVVRRGECSMQAAAKGILSSMFVLAGITTPKASARHRPSPVFARNHWMAGARPLRLLSRRETPILGFFSAWSRRPTMPRRG